VAQQLEGSKVIIIIKIIINFKRMESMLFVVQISGVIFIGFSQQNFHDHHTDINRT
jgi:hypothetical protein